MGKLTELYLKLYDKKQVLTYGLQEYPRGFVKTNLADSMNDPEMKKAIVERMDKIAIPPEAIARAVAFAIGQPNNVDVGDIVIRPTAQD